MGEAGSDPSDQCVFLRSGCLKKRPQAVLNSMEGKQLLETNNYRKKITFRRQLQGSWGDLLESRLTPLRAQGGPSHMPGQDSNVFSL